jgi:2-methylcitrate dehydratase
VPGQVVADDELAVLLAEFTARMPAELPPQVERAAERVVADSLAVALGALTHPASQAARRYAALFPAPGPSRIWGTRKQTTPEIATLVNGPAMRAYDYNDYYIGERGGGHPSDIVPGLVAVGEWRDAGGKALLEALALGYDVTMTLMDSVKISSGGWDYPNLTAIGAACAVARLMGLTLDQTREALAITVIPHAASLEIESSELNRRGDLTMWKRYNGADAVRHAVHACLLASVGVEGAVRPFVGQFGFLHLVNSSADALDVIRERLRAGAPQWRVTGATFKRWPVGSRGQSAIQAALAARSTVADVAQIVAVRITTDPAASEHLADIRDDPWAPISRETADHSMPYIIAAAVLDGRIHTDSFEPALVLDPARRQFLRERVTLQPDPALALGIAGGYPSRVEIETRDGRVHVGQPLPPPGHPRNPFSDADFTAKLHENVDGLLGAQRVGTLSEAIWSLHDRGSVRDLTALLQADVE